MLIFITPKTYYTATYQKSQQLSEEMTERQPYATKTPALMTALVIRNRRAVDGWPDNCRHRYHGHPSAKICANILWR